ncbi:sulfotransferase domain-containing protein [Mesorhizobium sp. RMAD-H1]|uniref:sulfotransferase domain-containing protein n=1 Tax=Mesorhizobium sp. RMAD-H1 TaxID=2587065 RepID=UPI00160E0DDB|nr:sulfotransferase domain-containing protein [Mesorhizobium sp. RMAD-H1]MBB2974184.1 glycosyltransferase involved in cell wall biosynthesis [Mesorhizobium sp. RMAD-H1]
MSPQNPPPKNILVACDQIVLAGGLLRFERFGRAIRDEGHSLSYLVFSPDHRPAWKSEFPVLTFDEAGRHWWDATFVPGAGFPPQTIDQFELLNAETFGVRVQHILNDQSRRDRFLQVNRSFRPNVIIFNNDHWPAGSYTEFQADRFFVIPGAVDTDLFAPAAREEDVSQAFVIGALANKNPEPLIAALEHLPQDVQLRFFGRDSTGIAEKHPDLLASGRIVLQGPVFDADLAAFYRQLDCVVMTEENAGWSNLVAEAMASGVPVVCTPHGTGVMAKDQETALVIDRPTHAAIAGAIAKLRGSPGLGKSLASAARAAIEFMDWHTYSAKVLVACDHRPGETIFSSAPDGEDIHRASKKTDTGNQKFEPGEMDKMRQRETDRSSSPLSRHFISYPKSGRTWIRFMLAQLDQADPIRFHHDGFEFNDGSLPPHDFSVQERLERYGKVDRIVYLERDPRDVMVSLYHQVTGRFRDFFNYQGTISDFIRDPYFGAHNLARFRAMWEQLCRQPNVLKITYEDCHRDSAQTLAKVLEFFELDASAADIARAVEAGSFDKMKELESSDQFPLPWLRPRNGAPKVRKGEVGGFRDSLASQDIAFLNDAFGFPRERPRLLQSIKRIFKA